MVTDTPQYLRERNLLPNHCGGFGILLFTDETNIARHIYPRRTGMFTGNEYRFPFLPHL
jgi:hypothetical protein